MASKISEDERKTVVQNEGKTEETSDDIADDKFQDVVEEQMQKTCKQFEMVKSKSDEAYKILKQDFQFVESQRKNFTEMSKKLQDVHFNDIVKLNVGGERFETSLETLTKFPNSLFGRMYSGSAKLKQGSDGTYFIDRDGSQFRSILNFLRREMVSPQMRENAWELIVEAKFYGLGSLFTLLSMPKEDEHGEAVLNDIEKPIEDDEDHHMTLEEHAKRSKEALDEAESCLKDGHASLKEDLSFLEEKRENFLEMAKKLRNVHFSDIVELRVGDHKFTTSIATLQSDPDSMLAAMFSKRFEPLKQKDGAYFIDRDGKHFSHILNYLRMGEIHREIIESVGSELLKEAEFYNLKGLIDLIAQKKSVKINTGGQIYAARIETLKRDPASLFAKMLTGNGAEVAQLDGAYFFVDTIKHMKEIFMFLEEGSLSMNVLHSDTGGLLSDAEYFKVETLINFISDLVGLKVSSIIGDEPDYQLQLRKWLKEKEMKTNPYILYSAEVDGWTAAKFHEHCDKKGPTLVLIESEHGCIFGGSTSQQWGGSNIHNDAKSFLFSLKSNEWEVPAIMPSNGHGGIHSEGIYGPTFHDCPGGYSSLYVADNPNTNQCSFTNRGVFTLPPLVPTTNTFLAGAQKFLVKKLEVYGV